MIQDLAVDLQGFRARRHTGVHSALGFRPVSADVSGVPRLGIHDAGICFQRAVEGDVS